MRLWQPFAQPLLTPSQTQDLRLAASQMTGVVRRAFQAEMALKYCRGSARLAETLLGWSREAVAVGLAEHRTGMLCLGAQSACSGRKRWEEHHPEVAKALRQLAEAHAQQDPTFRTTLAYTRLTAKAALEALRTQGVSEDHLPSLSTMAEVLNRMGYRLRKVLKARGHFPSDEAATKLIYLVLRDITKKWKNPPVTWKLAATQFAIRFGQRFFAVEI